ncbi:hypothetical protein ADICYQ_1536 [Cyclobacterium qasimii M12-11B]|uniref:Uncharacterized protein n=1 Tax=Cyclobacterium qasimii M12-11B TaxID=641524 RepID=S7WRR8_9BACT|nr:hypothetical protein ADICYQ_1536 [Cyclobacterium qasimii M12-11B]
MIYSFHGKIKNNILFVNFLLKNLYLLDDWILRARIIHYI